MSANSVVVPGDLPDMKTFRLTRREYTRLLAGLGTLGLLVGLVSGFREIVEPFTTSPTTALLTALGALLVGVAVVMMRTLWRSRAEGGKVALPLALLLVLLSSTTVGGVAVGTYLRTPGSPQASPTLTTSPTTTTASIGPTTTTTPPPSAPSSSPTAVPSSTGGPTVDITRPDPTVPVSANGTIVEGTSNLSATDVLWPIYRLANRSPSDNPSFQPADNPCKIQRGGTFYCSPVYLGGTEPEYAGREYDITLFLCDSAATQELRRYWQSQESKDYKGLNDAPKTARPLGTVTVKRK